MRWPLIILFALLVSLVTARCAGEASTPDDNATSSDGTSTLTIETSNGQNIEVEVEIADNEAERMKGLMERTELAENAGMLFVFEEEQPRSFWMKNTLIPLSIAYIDAEERIIDTQDMQPLDETVHRSAGPAMYALEVHQGFFEERGVEVGDTVELPPEAQQR
ncbi:MAG: DUF192 domain-containing protein [Actinomycetota bacterium]|nr:DUF192 domain-containing protein [Actinomycetota bacterium]